MEAYDYQKRIAYLLLQERRNVILQAPTGAGKTFAALLPFLNAIDSRRDFPQRCIYAVPMRVLANQFVEHYRQAVRLAGREEKIKVAIQTGEQQDSRELAHNLIFATIDQTLSSYLMTPYSLSPGKGNLNTGAVMSSYLVFDEFHLYDPFSTMPTTLHMLRRFKGITPFILMTATFSRGMLNGLGTALGAEVVPNDGERQQMLDLPSQNKTRRYHTSEKLNAHAVLDAHQGRSLVICNTVDRARYLFEMIRANAPTETQVKLLHSRFLPGDRGDHEDEIRQMFAKGSQNTGDYIVVATQAIEVGLDITSTALHTELAPANAILQRAGRCARYEHDEGDVYIYRQTEYHDEWVDLLEENAPYMQQKAEFENTWKAFQSCEGELKFDDEQEIITQVHGARDHQILDDLKTNSYKFNQDITYLMNGGSRSEARDFIRQITQQRVTIHPAPESIQDRIYELPSFGLHPGTLQKYLKQWLEHPDREDGDWAVKFIHEPKPDPQSRRKMEDATQANEDRYIIKEASTASEVKYAPLVIVNPRFATYHPDMGFIPEHGGNWYAQLPPQNERDASSKPHRYRLETYADHIAQVYAAFEEHWWEAEWAAKQLEKRYGWQTGGVRKAAELAVLLHDVGKLSQGWQKWAHTYQQRLADEFGDGKTPRPIPGEAYAHTEFVSSDETYRRIQSSVKPARPWHAVEGALAVVPILISQLGHNPILIKAVYSAIARHHAPFSHSNMQFQLIENSKDHILKSISSYLGDTISIDTNSSVRENDDKKRKNIIELNDDPTDQEIACYLVYCLIVRQLRRADQLGTARGAFPYV